jgi:transcriptional regulator with XRE-family HTH domain
MLTTGSWRSTAEWLQAIGSELRQRRIRVQITQVDLAGRAGVSLGAIKNLESGRGATLTSLVKVLRALGAEEWLGAVVSGPETGASPIQMLRERQRAASDRQPRQRVRKRRE